MGSFAKALDLPAGVEALGDAGNNFTVEMPVDTADALQVVSHGRRARSSR